MNAHQRRINKRKRKQITVNDFINALEVWGLIVSTPSYQHNLSAATGFPVKRLFWDGRWHD